VEAARRDNGSKGSAPKAHRVWALSDEGSD
jgi:hypothetical protein